MFEISEGIKCGEKKNQISVDLGRLLKWNRGGNQAWESNVGIKCGNQEWEQILGSKCGKMKTNLWSI